MPLGALVRRDNLPKARTLRVEAAAEEPSKVQTMRRLHPQSLFRIGGCSHAAVSRCRLTLPCAISNSQFLASRQANWPNRCDSTKGV